MGAGSLEDVVGASGFARNEEGEFEFIAEFKLDSEFNSYSKRLSSFHDWSEAVSATTLARSGFYRTGERETRCFCCELTLNNWSPNHSAFYRHATESPECLYIKYFFNCLSAAAPVYRRYESEEARVKSFELWPIGLKQRPRDMAAAGFFYTGEGDRTKCYHCGLGIKDWERDDEPWSEHARWADRCLHVLTLKGYRFVQQVISEKGVVETGVEKEERRVGTETEETEAETSEDDVPFERCRFCLLSDRDRCFVPCGHVVACGGCTLKFTHCPMCRCRIVKVLKLYY